MWDWWTKEQTVAISPLWLLVLIGVYPIIADTSGGIGRWLWFKTKERFFPDWNEDEDAA